MAHGMNRVTVAVFFYIHIKVSDCVWSHEFAMFVMNDKVISITGSGKAGGCLQCFFCPQNTYKLFTARNNPETARGFRHVLDRKTAGHFDNCSGYRYFPRVEVHVLPGKGTTFPESGASIIGNS